MRLPAIAAVVLASCIQSASVPCGSRVCPSSSTCVDDELCASADQLDACEGVADGGACTFGGAVGFCDRGVCLPAACGNNVVDIDELCDDGNQTSGDGCRADCRKVEDCGDAILDDGEGCDDGNANPADGCDACVPTQWRATALLDDAQATEVALSAPFAVAYDHAGNVYFADSGTFRIRRIDATGVISTIAGTGSPGSSVDGIPATSAALGTIWSIAVDGLRNVYITDGNRIRRISANGFITTVAGNGVFGSSGDGGPAVVAALANPSGVAVDGLGNIYIADQVNNKIRRVDVATGTITTIAGTGAAGGSGDGGLAVNATLYFPTGIAVDAMGTIYFADTQNHRIRKIATTGIITNVAGTGTSGFSGDNGSATSAQLSVPAGIAVDDLGNVFIADNGNQRVRRVNASGVITSAAGSGDLLPEVAGDGGPATAARLAYPRGVASDKAGSLVIADSGSNRIRSIDPAGIIETIAGGSAAIGDRHDARSAALVSATDIAFDSVGNAYIADANDNRVRRIDLSGVITTFAGDGTLAFGGDGGPASQAKLATPRALAF
ncbi:MAG TPA: DUF4215 domain-containing protein, partial [Kofleriaceae bacterium]